MLNSHLKWGLLLSYIGVCGGCTSFLEGEPPLPLYTLKAPTTPPDRGNSSLRGLPLTVEIPMTEMSLDTQRIAVTPCSYRRDYVAGGEWSDRLPKLFQDFLMETLTSRWGGANVNRQDAGLKIHRILQTEIQDFSLWNINGHAPYVHLKILVRLVDFPQRRVIGATVFEERTPLTARSLEGIVTAFNESSQHLVGHLITWLEKPLPTR